MRNEKVFYVNKLSNDEARVVHCKRRKKKWIVHRMRHNDYMVILIEGRWDGNVVKRKPKIQFMHQVVKKVKPGNYQEVIILAVSMEVSRQCMWSTKEPWD